jgi:hypothetical protein
MWAAHGPAAIALSFALAIAIEMLLSGRTVRGAPSSSNCTSIQGSLQHHNGIFVGDRHGDWEHARALQHVLCSQDGAPVKALFVEMLPATQHALTADFLGATDDPARADLVKYIWDKWRYGYSPHSSKGDGIGAGAEAAVTNHPSYQYKTSHPYFQLIQAAAQCGVEVVGIDVDRADQPSSGLAYMLGRTSAVNKAWTRTIEQHQRESREPEKYVVFGGRLHCYGIAASARTGLVHLLSSIQCLEWSPAEACYVPLHGR